MDQDEDKQYDDATEDELDGFHTDDEDGPADVPGVNDSAYTEEESF